jgi:uncharacterized protein
METTQAAQVPIVDYLVLDPEPHLVAQECTSCSARFFGSRVACANCFATDFRAVDMPTTGEVAAFTIVAYAPPGVEAPFVAAIVDCDGTWVRANLVEVEPDPAKISLGMKVALTTYPLGADTAGTEAIGFGFAPA